MAKPLAVNEARRVFRREASSSTTRTLFGCDNAIRRFLPDRDLHRKRNFVSGAVLDFQFQGPAMSDSDFSRDIQSQAGTRRRTTSVRSAIEALENTRSFTIGDRATCIRYLDSDRVALPVNGNGYVGVRHGVLTGVFDQLTECNAQQLRVR